MSGLCRLPPAVVAEPERDLFAHDIIVAPNIVRCAISVIVRTSAVGERDG